MNARKMLLFVLVAVLALMIVGRGVLTLRKSKPPALAERTVSPAAPRVPPPAPPAPPAPPVEIPEPNPAPKAAPPVATTQPRIRPAATPPPAAPPTGPAPGAKDPIQDPVARVALSLVGADPDAEEYWVAAINNPNLGPEERKDLIEDLNEDGLSDPKNPGPEDLPLIVNRLRLIEELAPYAMDDANADAFAEAYKDLVNLLDGQPVQ